MPRIMENINFITLSGFAGAIFIVLKFFFSKLPEFKNQGEYFDELYKKQGKVGEFEIKKITEGLI